MNDIEDVDARELDRFLRSIRDSRDEARRQGLVRPEEVERSADEAIARGLEQRERDRTAGQGVKRR